MALPLMISFGSENVVIEALFGTGTFGVVHKARNRSGREYALKDVACQNASAVSNALAEIGMLRQVSHQNIVQIIASGAIIVGNVQHILILTEFCSGGNLNERLNRPPSDSLTFKWMRQLASALSYLHDWNIMHRDLKPENVLLTDRSNEDIKIGDFGLARQYVALIQQGYNFSTSGGWIDYYMNTYAGSPPWMAPEVFLGHYTEKADVFSIGCIFYAILTRQYVYVNNRPYYGAFMTTPSGSTVGLGEAMARWNPRSMVAFPVQLPIPSSLKQVTLWALGQDPRNRPSARQLHDALERINTEFCLGLLVVLGVLFNP